VSRTFPNRAAEYLEMMALKRPSTPLQSLLRTALGGPIDEPLENTICNACPVRLGAVLWFNLWLDRPGTENGFVDYLEQRRQLYALAFDEVPVLLDGTGHLPLMTTPMHADVTALLEDGRLRGFALVHRSHRQLLRIPSTTLADAVTRLFAGAGDLLVPRGTFGEPDVTFAFENPARRKRA
jgi:hypothetical protein